MTICFKLKAINAKISDADRVRLRLSEWIFICNNERRIFFQTGVGDLRGKNQRAKTQLDHVLAIQLDR